ncbi:MAG TPA: hypothetical protein DDZ83_15275, partial [Nitrospinae bacterium]|nr:hypothetical protein [Nitrospinota bacterium]
QRREEYVERVEARLEEYVDRLEPIEERILDVTKERAEFEAQEKRFQGFMNQLRQKLDEIQDRIRLVEHVEGRIQQLSSSIVHLDDKIEKQLERHGEVDRMEKR